VELEGPQDDVVERTALAYERGAALYAEGGLKPRTMEREMMLFIGHLSPGAKVLDAGCGPGRDLKEMQALGFEVTGVDNSQELLDMVPKEIVTLKADLRSIPLPQASFEGVWAIASLLHLPRVEMKTALSEMRRLLVSGGHLMVSIKEGKGENWVADKGMEERFFTYYEGEELDQLLKGAGFEVEYSESKPAGVATWLTRIAVAR
jgi:ubiquinone/menaquinone biosynthesis C-methylase UbiE